MAERTVVFEKSLTSGFDFYQQGEVHEAPPDTAEAVPDMSADVDAFVFRLGGELSGFVAVLFERGLDLSACAEIGNIIASRFASDLRLRHGIEVMISPPIRTNPKQAQQAASTLGTGSITRKKYYHSYNGTVIRIEALVAALLYPALGTARSVKDV